MTTLFFNAKVISFLNFSISFEILLLCFSFKFSLYFSIFFLSTSKFFSLKEIYIFLFLIFLFFASCPIIFLYISLNLIDLKGLVFILKLILLLGFFSFLVRTLFLLENVFILFILILLSMLDPFILF